jgi:hypothetical protein
MARPLTQSGSTNQNLAHKASFGVLGPPSALTSVVVASEGLHKRKSDESDHAVPKATKKRQSVVKRGIKRL